MLRFSLFRIRIDISPLFFSVLTAFLILDKNGMAFPVIFFSFLHEASHFILMLVTGIKPKYIKLSLSGIQVELTEKYDRFGKFAVYSSGFILNFILAFIFYRKEKYVFFAINLLLGIFSFMPIAGTDGYEILAETVNIFGLNNKERVKKAAVLFSSGVFEILIIIAFMLTKNLYLLIAFIYILSNAIKC